MRVMDDHVDVVWGIDQDDNLAHFDNVIYHNSRFAAISIDIVLKGMVEIEITVSSHYSLVIVL